MCNTSDLERIYKIMFNKKFTSALIALGFLFSSLVLATPSAQAHVTAQLYGSSAKANGYGHLFFRVPHADKGKSTVKIDIQIPKGVTGVKPEQKAGWVESVTYADDQTTPVKVTWEGGNLPDTSFADFGISLKYPNTPGEVLYFSAVQTLNDGSTVAWIEIPAPGVDSHSLAKPSPSVKLEAAPSGHGHNADAMAHGNANAVKGDFSVKINGSKARVIVDLSSVLSGEDIKIHYLVGDKKVSLFSGKLDTRGDVFANISSKKSGSNGYALKKGGVIHLMVDGKMALEGKIA